MDGAGSEDDRRGRRRRLVLIGVGAGLVVGSGMVVYFSLGPDGAFTEVGACPGGQ